MRSVITLTLALTILAAAAQAAPLTAALVQSGLPDEPVELRARLAKGLASAGYQVQSFSFGDLCDAERLSAKTIDLLVLPDASVLPGHSISVVEAYLKGGGDILALNAPLWQKFVFDADGTWLDRGAFQRLYGAQATQHTVFHFASLEGWHRSTEKPETKISHTVDSLTNAPVSSALHVRMDDLNIWDTYYSPEMDRVFPEGHELTIFWAKGDADTSSLSVEWDEKDSSRWVAVVPLVSEWRLYVLAAGDFRFWESVPARAQTKFQPANAKRFCVGLSHTHTPMGGGTHEYWIGPVGTAPVTPLHHKLRTYFTAPALDTLCPSYKFFDSTEVAKLGVPEGGALVPCGDMALIKSLRSVHPRPMPGGFKKGRDWRFSPLLEAQTDTSEWRGIPAALTVHADGPYKGGVWASFAVDSSEWYMDSSAMGQIDALLNRMAEGVFIVDGGAEFYTYFADQPVTIGARVANLGKAPVTNAAAHIHLGGKDVRLPLTIAPGAEQTVSQSLPAGAVPDGGCEVVATIERDGAVLDQARHETHVWKPKAKKSFITYADGEFLLDGTRWRAHGVNYMPSSGVGTEDWDYFEHWVGARAYDPAIIQRDLEHVKDMGMNSVSIFIYRKSMEAQNLLDLLRRIDALGMKANLSLRPGTPLEFQWDAMREMIEYYRLAENDTVFAYDLAWEPMFGEHKARTQWDAHWRKWVIERYGSIENAEKDWGFTAPRDANGNLTNPLPKQTVEDGDHRVMVAAYRRFLDTLLYEHYSRARTLVRSIDPNHAVSFRMTLAGDPTWRGVGRIPYDFAYLAGAVDIIEPEAYGRIGNWERVKPGWFTHAYARWARPELPMIWAEAGIHVWEMGRMESPMQRKVQQAEFYERIYRLLIESCADGIFFWWYPGGLRVNERSDYGITNPDGSDRPVTRVIREKGPLYMNGPTVKPIDHWIEIDRAPHPDGIAGLYDAVKDEFWDAIAKGKTPGLKTEAAGTTSANCPLVAVGNRPLTGSNPPKYLDGFFDRVEVRNANGQWEVVARGATIEVDPAKPVVARVTVTNLGEASWVAPKDSAQEGGVFITTAGDVKSRTPLPKALKRFETSTLDLQTLAPAGLQGSARVILSFEASGRAAFGPRYEFTIRVQES